MKENHRLYLLSTIIAIILIVYLILTTILGEYTQRELFLLMGLLILAGPLIWQTHQIMTKERLRKRLHVQTEGLFYFFEDLPFGVFTEDVATGRIQYWNQWLVDMTLIKKSEAIEKAFSEVFDEEQSIRVKASNRMESDPNYEVIYKDQNEIEHIFKIKKIQMNILSEMNVRLVIVNDLTEYKLLEKKVLQSDKMNAIGQLAGGIAHDFNNQLMGIAGHASLLYERVEGSERKHIQKILHQTQVASELVHKLLTFSNQNLHFEKFINIQTTLEHALSSLHFEEKKVEIIKEFETERCYILGDEAFMESAFLNIVKNAYEAIDDSGYIKIKVYEKDLGPDEIVCYYQDIFEGTYCIIEISDSGSLANEEEICKWFEPFYTTKPFGEGHGMGLSAVYGTITKHNGGIKVTSEPTKGTTFTVALPLKRKKRSEGSLNQIVILDDDEIVCELIEEVLISNGYKDLQIFSDVDGAFLNVLDETQILITDKNVHEDFQAFVKKTIVKHDKLVIIGVSGYFTESDRQILSHNPRVSYIEKPIETKQLIATIESYF